MNLGGQNLSLQPKVDERPEVTGKCVTALSSYCGVGLDGGAVKIRLHRYRPKSKIKNLQIVRKATEWYDNICMEVADVAKVEVQSAFGTMTGKFLDLFQGWQDRQSQASSPVGEKT